ncbi:hypothetical protein M413DRAFT_442826 [Hebeloma cylindrosporum]|uniref:Post-SET domain-containing protein n=1 Tax=Hebeloma cylindrosporum TaxID=76867 RepID=A0A0C3CM52_HEBCY|nr:hypothetical protein M413DRAFT_442826 [Hebeloma cylindrosporum h7]
MPKPTQDSYIQSYREFLVEFAPGENRSSLKSLKAFKAGETMAVLKGLTKGQKAYTSVQCGRGPEDHIELNSDLVYINHSCEPNVAFDLSSPDRAKWHLRALKNIQPGDTLNFFYPGTEWDMDQPFDCECGTPSCLGKIQGAKYLSKRELVARGFISPWILESVAERDSQSSRKLQNRL